MSRSRAFTLIELLTTIAIVVLLAALAVPVLGKVLHSGRVTNCLSQMRQLQLASTAYATSHGGMMIDADLGHGGVDGEYSFVDTLEEYADHPLARRSPLDESPHWPAEAGGEGVPLGAPDRYRRTSYGLNDHLTSQCAWLLLDPRTDRVARRLSQVADAANTISFLMMAFEGDFAAADHPHVNEWYANPPVVAATQVQTGAVGGKPATWEARSNWAFLDGRVETLAFYEVYARRFDLDGSGSTNQADTLNRFDPSVSARWATLRALRTTP